MALTKQKKISINPLNSLDIAESNIAGLGGDIDKQCRLHAAETEKVSISNL
jgi:hypothetical protein